MRSNSGWSVALLALFAVSSSSCGILGKKADLNALLNYNPQGVGCMNNIAAHMSAYYQGTIDVATWGATWDCATTNLTLFKQFVHASDPSGFTQSDIQAFVSKFLITNRAIPADLISAFFELKASLFGGSKNIIAPSEVDAVVAFLNVLKAQSTILLPYMALRATLPSPDNLLELTDALLAAGDQIANALKTQGNPVFSFTATQTLATQLGNILHINVQPDLVAWLNVVKAVLTAGNAAGVAAKDWPIMIRSIVSYGGPALAVFSVDSKYLTGPNAIGRFGMQLGWKIKASLLQTLDLYGGALPLTALYGVIDSLPANWLSIDHNAIKVSLPPLVNKIMQSRVPNAIDSSSIDLVFDKLQYWSDRQTGLETVFANLNAGPLGVTLEAFDPAVSAYADSLPASARPPVFTLSPLAHETRPVFLGDDNQMTFTGNLNYSLHDLSLFNVISIVADQLVRTYSTVPGGILGQESDLQAIANDFTALVRELKAADVTAPGWATARFLEATLFTFASRGDPKTISIDEVTQLIAMAFSAGEMGAKITAGTDAACPSQGVDILGAKWKSAACFRAELFGNFHVYWDHQPLLVQFYQNLSAADRSALQVAMETSARRYGYSEQPIASADEVGFAGIIQYVETLLARWDINEDQHMDLNESNNAYPIFKGQLVALGNMTSYPDWLVKSIFTYILKNGHRPSMDFSGITSLIGWIAETPFWSLTTDRLKLYQVIGSIVVPAPLPGASPAPSPESYIDLAAHYGLKLDGGISPLLQPLPMPTGL